ncbi:lactate utilization protein C, partial [Pseudonocardia sp. SID8383]|nr:lactate utilization protein C [Pseudonocardia sp. SID8383]
MSAREAILAKARRALTDVPDVEPVLDVEVVRPVPDRSLPHAQVVDLFDERVADYRAVVERADPGTAAARVAGALAGR